MTNRPGVDAIAEGTLFLVTGGAGFIGSHLVDRLLGLGMRVRVMDDFSTGKRSNLAPFLGRIELVESSLLDLSATARACEGATYVLHQAAIPSVPRSVRDPLATHHACVTGTANLLEGSRLAGVRRVVYAASSSAYGNQPASVKSEGLLPMPLSPYAAAKLAGEHYMRAWHEVYGLESVALRYFNVFGPRQDPLGEYAAVIPRFIVRILRGEEPVIYGDGLQSRDFTYVSNNVEANLLACVAPGAAGRVFNIACGESYSLLDLARELGRLTGREVRPRFEPARAGDVRHSRADISEAREVLGYEPAVGFAEGLRRTLEHFQAPAGAQEPHGTACQ